MSQAPPGAWPQPWRRAFSKSKDRCPSRSTAFNLTISSLIDRRISRAQLVKSGCDLAGQAPAKWPVMGPRGAPITTGAYQTDTSLPNFSETETVTTGQASEKPKQRALQPVAGAEIKIEEERGSSEKLVSALSLLIDLNNAGA